MKTSSSQLKANARGHLSGRYSVLILAYITANLIINIPLFFVSYTITPDAVSGFATDIIDTGISLILSFISAIFLVGQNRICLRYARSSEPVPISEMWYGFKGKADTAIITYFLFLIRLLLCSVPFIAFLAAYLYSNHSLIFGVLAIIGMIFMIIMCIKVNLDYSFIFFLLIDYPDESPKALLAHSKRLMNDNRGRLLYLQLSFIGMWLLVVMSFGAAIFWVFPYTQMTLTEFYLEVSED